MKYFGVASCPYCKKRVNLLRTWSLKRQGEYQCPRCNGISNIFLSPLIYVFALLAVFSGGAAYFFHKFILDDISLSTVGQVLLPFAVFFLLSLFMVHLEKPVIKKMTPAEIARKQRKERNQLERKTGQRPVSTDQRSAPSGQNPGRTQQNGSGKQALPAQKRQMLYDSEEYLPRKEYHTGTLPAPANQADLAKTAEVELPKAVSAQRTAPAPVRRAAPVQRSQGVQGRQAVSVQQGPQVQAAQVRQGAAVQPPAAANQTVQPGGYGAAERKTVSRPVSVGSGTPSRPVTHGNDPGAGGDDFFAKYDDPNYVERRLQELQQGRKNTD